MKTHLLKAAHGHISHQPHPSRAHHATVGARKSKVYVPHPESPIKTKRLDFEVLDSIRIKNDIPGTELKRGMHGAIVNLYGKGLQTAEIEVIEPPIFDFASTKELELIKRY